MLYRIFIITKNYNNTHKPKRLLLKIHIALQNSQLATIWTGFASLLFLTWVMNKFPLSYTFIDKVAIKTLNTINSCQDHNKASQSIDFALLSFSTPLNIHRHFIKIISTKFNNIALILCSANHLNSDFKNIKLLLIKAPSNQWNQVKFRLKLSSKLKT